MVNQAPFEFDEEIDFEIISYSLNFLKPARTSRDVLTNRTIYFVKVFYRNQPNLYGIGECAPIYGLNPEKEDAVKTLLTDALKKIKRDKLFVPKSINLPAIRFSIETAVFDLINNGKRLLFGEMQKNTRFPINGLVWMNQFETMLEEAIQKVESGYKVIKLKIGGIDFDDEIRILGSLRDRFGNKIIIRLDANGGFSNEEAISKLNQLAKFDIHSIEQPIRAGQWNEMRSLCSKSPIPIALDEELIGIEDTQLKFELINTIQPQFIVLKPTLHGGFSGCDEWIEIADNQGLNWWATSALESNIGLNAIAQWLTTKNVQLEQGLGTGSLYLNNLSPAWVVNNGYLEFDGLDSLSHDISNLR